MEDLSKFHNVISLLLDGKEFDPDSSNEDKLVLEERFIVSDFYNAISEGPAGSMMDLMIFDSVLMMKWKRLGADMTKAKRKCKLIKNSNDRDKCTEKVKIIELQQRLTLIERAKSQCSRTEKPENCYRQADELMSKMNERLIKMKTKYKKRWR